MYSTIMFILQKLFCRKEHMQLKTLSYPCLWDEHCHHQSHTIDHHHATRKAGAQINEGEHIKENLSLFHNDNSNVIQ